MKIQKPDELFQTIGRIFPNGGRSIPVGQAVMTVGWQP